MRNAYTATVAGINASMASMSKPATLRTLHPAVRYYGAFKTGILAMKKAGFTNEEIAEHLWKVAKAGPRATKGNVMVRLNMIRKGDFSITTAVQYLSIFTTRFC